MVVASHLTLLLLALTTSFICYSSADFVDFVPHNETKTCTGDIHTNPFNRQVRGVNLGGWLVLEPWIAPSLFYQFLGTQARFGDKAPEKTGMDMYTFCTALGPEEANRQLRLHWKKWVTEEDIEALANYGLNSLRIPVGDWMFNPYEPYIGCTDGAVEELDRVLDLATKYNMDVLIDIHAHRGSQNGFDNSGKSHTVKWTSLASSLPIGTTTFEHWPIRTAEWVGTFDAEAKNYSSINYDNIKHSLTAVTNIVKQYKDHPAILGIEPVNEPWELTPLDILKDFYWEGYLITKSLAPKWKYVMHDSFRFGVNFWGGFMAGCPDIALDTHIYQAWNNPGSREDVFANACQQKFTISSMEQTLMPVIVGEWSLATDNCAMWLNGMNDNLPGFPKVQCDYIPCAESYLGDEYTGLGLDRTKPIQGPYGTGVSGPSFGNCPISNSKSFDIDDNEMFTLLGRKKLNAFTVGHGFYFWNFKNELDPKWDFLQAAKKNWLVVNDPKLDDACVSEDHGEFLCHAKRGVHKVDIKGGLAYACGQMNCTGLNVTYPNLYDRADYVFNAYWQVHRMEGATCDFNGAASLKSPPGILPPVDPMRVTAAPEESKPSAALPVTTKEAAAVASKNSTTTTMFRSFSFVLFLTAGAVMVVHYRRRRRANTARYSTLL